MGTSTRANKFTGSLPDPRTTPWAAMDGGVEKRVRWVPGYDCRVRCVHDEPGRHGHHGDELHLALRLPDFGLSLGLSTGARAGIYFESAFDRDRGAIEPYSVLYHHPYPTEEEEVRDGRPNEICDVLTGGRCYGSGGLTCFAEKLWTPTETRALGDHLLGADVEFVVLGLTTGVWDRMAAALKERRTVALAAYAALPVQCPHCKGKGLLPQHDRPS